MEISKIVLSYESNLGSANIRTIYREENIYFSLPDVVKMLAAENRELSKDGEIKSFNGILRAHSEALLPDERIIDNKPNAQDPLPYHLYVSQSGLFRVILRDTSPACVRFQKWVLEDVLPSIQRYGTYPPPTTHDVSEIKRLTMLLLSDIEAREQAEKETQLRFEQHEKMLTDLSKKIEDRTSNYDSENYFFVDEYCAPFDLTQTQLQLTFGWCLHLCETEYALSKKSPHSTGRNKQFPDHVINKAMDIACSQQK
jgi:prophage antirepressor-like protein